MPTQSTPEENNPGDNRLEYEVPPAAQDAVSVEADEDGFEVES